MYSEVSGTILARMLVACAPVARVLRVRVSECFHLINLISRAETEGGPRDVRDHDSSNRW